LYWALGKCIFALGLGIGIFGMTQNIGCKVFFFLYRNFHANFYKYVQVVQRSLILGKWMRSEIVESNGERPTINDAMGGFSVFLASRISHSICASQVSSYVLRPVVLPIFYKMSTFFHFSGVVLWICRWSPAQILGRVSFSAYLVHVGMIKLKMSFHRQPIYAANYLLVSLYALNVDSSLINLN
jgi:peptidoglycan/LPS O-acetylase OafA/YrhL